MPLAETLRRLRRLSGKTLRQVERECGISNAYLSQLEGGTPANPAPNPSPQKLHKLAECYGVPYELLMEEAGYLEPQPEDAPHGRKRLGAVEAALLSAKLTREEQERVVDFIEFLRSQGRRKRQT